MNYAAVSQDKPHGSWAGTISLVIVHTIAFAMLYLVVVQINWAFRDYFNLVGTNPTSRFQSASLVADYTAAYTPVVLMILAIHLVIVFRLSRGANRWASAYSHGVLLCMGFAGFICVSCAVHTMVWSKPGIANPQNVANASINGEQLIAADVDTDN
ncbi:hypothetical protein FYK55_00445 [Roseiconus nitratireducens]|uniref:Uncharacterized protein n=1 Tax=Roseiconus nitratireducens TaxID=2605748 RepID=A0A5M6DL25_9BACT|nr:hypothetical protein [Roseiconus nitratireducens]KAA5546929.1 hypothetical protein FYK55_00445 [Roseiconus nitratireducens]